MDAATQELLTVEQAAERLNVGRTTTYSLIATGELASVKIGRRRLVPPAATKDLVERLRDGQFGDAA